jgi:hypothetical protein
LAGLGPHADVLIVEPIAQEVKVFVTWPTAQDINGERPEISVWTGEKMFDGRHEELRIDFEKASDSDGSDSRFRVARQALQELNGFWTTVPAQQRARSQARYKPAQRGIGRQAFSFLLQPFAAQRSQRAGGFQANRAVSALCKHHLAEMLACFLFPNSRQSLDGQNEISMPSGRLTETFEP